MYQVTEKLIFIVSSRLNSQEYFRIVLIPKVWFGPWETNLRAQLASKLSSPT